jgi:hypothetical protein
MKTVTAAAPTAAVAPGARQARARVAATRSVKLASRVGVAAQQHDQRRAEQRGGKGDG